MSKEFTPINSKEELLAYLAQNLRLDFDQESGYYGETTVIVKVLLENVEFHTESTYVTGSTYVSSPIPWNSSDC